MQDEGTGIRETEKPKTRRESEGREERVRERGSDRGRGRYGMGGKGNKRVREKWGGK